MIGDNFNESECTGDITHTINTRIYDRNVPSQMLQPYLSVYPVSTKYSVLPIVDPRKNIKPKLVQMPTYNQHTTFNPGMAAPWSGFAANINRESDLRGQVYALQKCSQAVYVPSSQSDMYQYSFHSASATANQQYPELFAKQHFPDFNPNPNNIGNLTFNNSTRYQNGNIPPDKCIS